MFFAKHSQPKTLLNVFDSLSTILDNITLFIRKDGIYSTSMDSSHVCLAELNIEKEDFEEYNLENNKEFYFSINIPSFVSILKIAKNAKSLDLKITNQDKLSININTQYDIKKFKINLLSVEDDNQFEMPDHDYPCSIELSPNIYNDIISSCFVVESDTIQFNIKDNKLTIIANGNIGDFTHTFNDTEFKEKKKLVLVKKTGEKQKVAHPKSNSYKIFDCTGTFSLDFSLKYFKLFSKANILSNKVSINLIDQNPIRLDYELSNNGSFLNYYLAPKITDE